MSFIDKLLGNKPHRGEKVYLIEKYRTDEKSSFDGVPTVYYEIYENETHRRVGSLDLRLSIEGEMYYYGHIGYSIAKQYRGHNYAYYACKIAFEIAKNEFNMDELIITCSPENIASYKTLKKLNGELIDHVEVPREHLLYSLGEKTKYIFRYKISL